MRESYLDKLRDMLKENKKLLRKYDFYEGLNAVINENNSAFFNHDFYNGLRFLRRDHVSNEREDYLVDKMIAEFCSFVISDYKLRELEQEKNCCDYALENKERLEKYLDFNRLWGLIKLSDCRESYAYSSQMAGDIIGFLNKNKCNEIEDDISRFKVIIDFDGIRKDACSGYALDMSFALDRIEKYEESNMKNKKRGRV